MANAQGSGSVSLRLDAGKSEMCFVVALTSLDQPVALHLHEGALGTEASDILAALPAPPTGEGTASGCLPADALLIDRVVAGPDDFFLDVHTQQYPAGAVRGQLQPVAG